MKYVLRIILLLLTLLLLKLNLNLHLNHLDRQETMEDILSQLNFLEYELKENDLGNRMQMIFPEGNVFIHALYGLSWCELASADSANWLSIKDRALEEAMYAFEQINSPALKSTFNRHLEPAYGAFYSGWKNYLLSKIQTIDTSFQDYEKYKGIFLRECESIFNALNKSNTPYLQSYADHSWPADMFVAMTSLGNHDRIYGQKYSESISNWLLRVESLYDQDYSMVPHKVRYYDGRTLQGARGSSSTLVIRMLSELSPELARLQYARYEEHFISRISGLPMVREYPKGKRGAGDIDSGPVIFNVGFSATIVSIGAHALTGEVEESMKVYRTIDALGFSRTKADHKKYIWGKLPVADAFIAWGRSSALNTDYDYTLKLTGWRWKFHLLTFFLLLLFWMPVLYKERHRFYRRHVQKNPFSGKEKK